MRWWAHPSHSAPQENHCDSFEPKQKCQWEDLLEVCHKVSSQTPLSRSPPPYAPNTSSQCEHKGCAPVVSYLLDNEALNATYGDNAEAKGAAMDEMAWRDACEGAVDNFPKFETCIRERPPYCPPQPLLPPPMPKDGLRKHTRTLTHTHARDGPTEASRQT